MESNKEIESFPGKRFLLKNYNEKKLWDYTLGIENYPGNGLNWIN